MAISQTLIRPARPFRPWAACALALAVVSLCAGCLAGMGPAAQVPYKTNTQVADLDSDGDLDVIMGHTRWASADVSWAGITLWLNQGDGQFTRSSQSLPGGFAVAAADVDRDGDADLLILDGYALLPAINRGGAQLGQAGVFRPGTSIRPANAGSGHADMGGTVTVGDFDNDGAPDVFVANCCYGSGAEPRATAAHIPAAAWVWINRWDVHGGPPGEPASLGVLDGLPTPAVATGDLDGDGDQDVFAAIGAPAIGTAGSLDDVVLLNDGAGNFTASGQALGDGGDSTAVALGDVDGDADLDALVGTPTQAILWINQGGAQGGRAGRFARAAQDLPGDRTRAVFLTDLDGDGDPDALIGGPQQAVIWWNDGRGSFTPSTPRLRYAARDGLAAGDFNGDGFPDIFAGGATGAGTTWLNQGDGTFRARLP